MKVLSIGNSFSSDATYYIKKMADSVGVDVTVVNLYIGGCTLETHASNIKHNAPDYLYELNGAVTDRMISVQDALRSDVWDVVTVQQQSGHAGVYESYGEHLDCVLDCVHRYAPQAKVYFHETWAYEVDSDHPEFAFYNHDRDMMRRCITEVTSRICAEKDLPMIPSGSVIAQARQLPAFDYGHGGQTLCRDGFHMHLIYGRYLLGLVWLSVLMGIDAETVTFVPTPADIINGHVLDPFVCDASKLEQLKVVVKQYVQK